MLAFFIITVSNERCPPMYTLHLKCFPIKGEPRPVENIFYRGYSLPKCTCNGHVPQIHIHIPSKNMQLLLWNPTCHAMKSDETQSCTMPRVLTDSHHTRVFTDSYYTMPKPVRDKIHHFWITSNDHFTKQIHLLPNQKLFGCYTLMIIYIQNSCVFCGQRIFGVTPQASHA